MWYYVLIIISVVMFGGGFGLQDMYRKKRGSGFKISMESTCIGALAGLVVLLAIDGLSFEFTPFTLFMASLVAINNMAFTFCAFKALDYINLSLFSLFAMLGGMALPFFQGIIFYNEAFTLAKVICVVFIVAALSLTVEKGEKKNGTFFYAGIFILNGMSGVLSKLFTESTLPKASAAGYSAWCAAVTVVMSGAVWLLLSLADKQKKISKKSDKKALLLSYGIGALQGSLNKIANFLIVVAIANMDASVLSPMVTGGTMIVSTLISCFGDKKPSRREMLSVLLAFLGTVALFVIPV